MTLKQIGLALFIFSFVITACKKADDVVNAVNNVNIPVDSIITLDSVKLNQIYATSEMDSITQTMKLVDLASDGKDSMVISVVFNSMSPIEGIHSFLSVDKDATLAMSNFSAINGLSKQRLALAGKCKLSKVNGKLNVSFVNITVVDSLKNNSVLSGGFTVN